MLVAQELRAEGQVTERALNLAAINSVVAFVLVTMLLSWIHHEYRAGWLIARAAPGLSVVGSLVARLCRERVVAGARRAVSANTPERHFVLLLGLVVATVGAARMLELSVLIALLAFGVLVRNLDERHDLMSVDLGRVGQLFFVVLFVVTGARLRCRS